MATVTFSVHSGSPGNCPDRHASGPAGAQKRKDAARQISMPRRLAEMCLRPCGEKVPPGTRDFQMMKTSPCQARGPSPIRSNCKQARMRRPALQYGFQNIHKPLNSLVSLLGAKAPAKILEVTLMRPIHGNL
jgi:hypothetical protein